MWKLCVCSVAQYCLTLCAPLGWVARQVPQIMGFFQAKILEWVAIFSSRESHPWVSCVSCNGRQILHHRATQEAPSGSEGHLKFQRLSNIHWVLPGPQGYRIYLDVVSIGALRLTTFYPKFCYYLYMFRPSLLIIYGHVLLQGKAH